MEIGGTTVQLATLHNFDLIRAKDLRVGDVVQVKRAGDVIPQVIGPVPERRDPTNPPANPDTNKNAADTNPFKFWIQYQRGVYSRRRSPSPAGTSIP